MSASRCLAVIAFAWLISSAIDYEAEMATEEGVIQVYQNQYSDNFDDYRAGGANE